MSKKIDWKYWKWRGFAKKSSGAWRNMTTSTGNLLVTDARLNDVDVRNKLNPVYKNFLQRQNPYEIVFRDISKFNWQNPIIESLLTEIESENWLINQSWNSWTSNQRCRDKKPSRYVAIFQQNSCTERWKHKRNADGDMTVMTTVMKTVTTVYLLICPMFQNVRPNLKLNHQHLAWNLWRQL